MALLWNTIRSVLVREQSLPPITIRSAGDIVPLTFGQQRVWFIEKLMSHRPQHLLNHNLEIAGALDIERLRLAMRHVVDRHEALRTRIEKRDGIVHQHVEPAVSMDLEIIDLRANRPACTRSDLDSMLQSLMPRTFNVEVAPLWRFCLVRLSDKRNLLIGRIHHLVFDRWSQDIFNRTLFERYGDERPNGDAGLPATVDYGDFALWQRSYYNETWMSETLARWRAFFGSDPVATRFPGDRQLPPVSEGMAGMVTRAIPEAVVERLVEYCNQRGISLFTFLFAAFLILLYKYTGQCDLTVSSPVSGRTSRQMRSILGFFSNVVVYRVVLDPDDPIDNAMHAIVERIRGFEAFLDLPLDAVATSQEMRTFPIDETMFAFHNTPQRSYGAPELCVRRYKSSRRRGDHRFSLSVYSRDKRYFVQVSYRQESYTPGYVETAISGYVDLLNAVAVRPPGTRLGQL